jgi:hypothetical protein
MMNKGLIGRLLSLEAEELPPDAARESADQLRTPTLDERARLYLRAVHGKQDFGSEAYSKARNRILNAMATDIAVKFEIPDSSETPVDHDETQWLNALSRRPYEYRYTRASAANADESTIAAAMASPRYVGMASPRRMYEEDFAAPEPEISPRRRQPFKLSLRTIGTLSIMVCAAAVIAGAGTLLFSRNDESSLAWFALPQRSAKTEVASQSSGSKAASLMPATVKPPTVTSESPNQQPSPEELAELVKRGRALLNAENASRAVSVVQALVESPTQQIRSEELAELVKRGSGLLGTGTASLLPSLAASQAVASGSPTVASALAWYQNSKDFGSTESIGSVNEKRNPN